MRYYLTTALVIMGFAFAGLPAAAQFTTEKAIDSTHVEVEDQKMELMVLDYKTKKSMEADVMVKGLNTRKTVIFQDLIDTTLILKNYRIYTVSVVKKGYMYFAHKFWPEESTLHIERVELKPLSIGLKTSVEDITFLGDDTQIYHKSVPALEELIEFLNVNSTVTLNIIGHANGPVNDEHLKSDSFYRKASEKRAQAVVDYLIQHGIAKERLVATGMGNKHMIFPDPQTDWQVDANRRIEIEITGL